MSLKHNPFDNSYKGSLIKRKKVFESPPIPEAPKAEVSPSPTTVPPQENLNRVQESSKGSLKVNRVQQKGSNDSIEFNQLGSKGFIEEPKRAQESSLGVSQSGSLEVKRVQIGSVNPNEPSIGEAKVLRWLSSKKLEDLTILFRAEECSSGTGLTREGAKTAVKRLRTKGLVELLEARRGRYTAFGLYRLTEKGEEFLAKKNSTPAPLNWVQESSLGFNNRVQIGSCSSSKDLNLKETTTTDGLWINVPEKLQGQLPLNQLRSMVRDGVIDQETLEDSLWGFAHDLEKGLVKSKTGNTTGLFIGALKNGGYISQQYLSQKQKEALELRERVEELKKVREELESNRLAEEFEAFKRDFPEEAEAMKPMSSYIKSFEQGGVGYKLWLDEFRKNRSKSGNA